VVPLIALFVVAPLIPARPDAAVRYAGLGLYPAGMVIVLFTIGRLRKQFGRKGFWSSARDALAAFGRRLRPRKIVSSTAKVASESLSTGEGVAVVHTDGATGLEAKVARIEQKLVELEHADDAERKEIASLRAGVEGATALIRASIDHVHRSAQLQLEAAIVGDLHSEIVGLVWLLAAQIMTTIPCELARLWSAAPGC
jgi:hypothetical protein